MPLETRVRPTAEKPYALLFDYGAYEGWSIHEIAASAQELMTYVQEFGAYGNPWIIVKLVCFKAEDV